jgi:pimeloyl-ACP methyl ester carboxylesterase
VIAAARAKDNRFSRLPQFIVDRVLPEVGAYLTAEGAMAAVDEVVADKIRAAEKRIVVVAHSLGAIVAFRVLTALQKAGSDARAVHLITLGGPLGVNAVVDRIKLDRPLVWPGNVRAWSNFFDKRDMVSLAKPVDRDSLFRAAYGQVGERPGRRFDVRNFVDVANDTDNHHGISGYLKDPLIASTILGAADELLGGAA